MQSFALTLDTTLGRALLRVAARQMGASIHVTRLLRCYGNCSFGLHTNGREHIKIFSLLSVVHWHKRMVGEKHLDKVVHFKVALFIKHLLLKNVSYILQHKYNST